MDRRHARRCSWSHVYSPEVSLRADRRLIKSRYLFSGIIIKHGAVVVVISAKLAEHLVHFRVDHAVLVVFDKCVVVAEHVLA